MLPFLTSYDPPGTSEGTLDPLGNNDTGSENTAIGATPSKTTPRATSTRPLETAMSG